MSWVDEELVEAISDFQRQRVLRPTGVVDASTHSAMLQYRALVGEFREERERKAQIRHLGAATELADPERVAKTKCFEGTWGWAPFTHSVYAAAARGGHPPTLWICDRGGPEFAAYARFATRRGVGVGVAVETAPRAHSRASPDVDLACVIVAVGEGGFQAAAEAVEAHRPLGVPIGIAGSCDPRRSTPAEVKLWRDAARLADAYLPIIPSPGREAMAPEYVLGRTVAEWCIHVDRRAAKYMFPVVDADQLSDNHFDRVRAWCSGKGMRGLGIRGLRGAALKRAFSRRDPHPPKIDGALRGRRQR